MSVKSFNNYLEKILPGCGLYDFSDKERACFNHIAYMLNRLQSMFKWSGLPDSIPQRIIELYTQVNGYCGIAKHNKTLYCFRGALGGEPNEYYLPTTFVVSNPYLQMSRDYKVNIEEADAVIIPNDSLYIGLMPLCSRYASLLTENDLSIKIASVNSRIISLIGAGDDRTRKSAEKYIDDIEQGKQGIIAENAFLDGVRVQPYGNTSNSNSLTNLIELEQYIKASWFNELGLNANYNMKRESLNSAESQLNDDALLPLVDDMLNQRKLACEKINAMFGTNISVSLSSSWEDNQDELDAEQENISGQPETETETENDGGEPDGTKNPE